MKNTQLIDQVVSFAGICQAAELVQQVARHGNCEPDALERILNSILITEPDSVEDVFGGLKSLEPGLDALLEQLNPTSRERNSELTRYVVNLVALERKTSRQRGLFQMLGERIDQVKRSLDHLELLDDQVVANLASIYSDLISPVGPRIQVAGSPGYLKQSLVQHKVRAILLSGLRAAVLWRQVGGRRRQLIFGRKKLLDTARYLKTQINDQ